MALRVAPFFVLWLTRECPLAEVSLSSVFLVKGIYHAARPDVYLRLLRHPRDLDRDLSSGVVMALTFALSLISFFGGMSLTLLLEEYL